MSAAPEALRRHLVAALLLAPLALALLAGCERSTQEILDKAGKADTKAKLIDALGDPDAVNKLGPLESWTYKASNGEVTFVIVGDRVELQAAGQKRN
jgi:hypothetical protein